MVVTHFRNAAARVATGADWGRLTLSVEATHANVVCLSAAIVFSLVIVSLVGRIQRVGAGHGRGARLAAIALAGVVIAYYGAIAAITTLGIGALPLGALALVAGVAACIAASAKWKRWAAGVVLFLACAAAGVAVGWGLRAIVIQFEGIARWGNIAAIVAGLGVGNVLLARGFVRLSSSKFRDIMVRLIIYEVFLAYSIVVIFPMVWVFYTSAKPSRDVFEHPFALPRLVYEEKAPEGASEAAQDASGVRTVTVVDNIVENYWKKALIDMKFGQNFFNSVIIVSISLVLILLLASMAAYALARFKFGGSRFLLYFFLAGLMVPMQLALIPLFFEYSFVGKALTSMLAPLFESFGLKYEISLFDSRLGLILIYVATSLPFTIFILVGFFRTIPTELHEAAMIDGCGQLRAFWHVMLPLAKPGLVTVAIFNFLGLWNEYIFGLTFINSDTLKTVPLGLANMLATAQQRVDYGLLFAGLVILMLPTLVVYILLQKRLVKGITMGALKG